MAGQARGRQPPERRICPGRGPYELHRVALGQGETNHSRHISSRIAQIFSPLPQGDHLQTQCPRKDSPGSDETACVRHAGETADLPGPAGDGGSSDPLHSSPVGRKGEPFRVVGPRGIRRRQAVSCSMQGMLQVPSRCSLILRGISGIRTGKRGEPGMPDAETAHPGDDGASSPGSFRSRGEMIRGAVPVVAAGGHFPQTGGPFPQMHPAAGAAGQGGPK